MNFLYLRDKRECLPLLYAVTRLDTTAPPCAKAVPNHSQYRQSQKSCAFELSAGVLDAGGFEKVGWAEFAESCWAG